MDLALPDTWAYMYYGLIVTITVVLLLVVYVLGKSTHPPRGLGMFTVYFVAALLSWIALTFQQGAGVSLTLDLPAIAAIISSYIMFLAVGERAQNTGGRYLLGLVCLSASIGGFFLQSQQMFLVQACSVALFYLSAGIIAVRRTYVERNAGDAMVVAAALIIVIGTLIALYGPLLGNEPLLARAIISGVQSTGYVIVAMGFLIGVVLEYQRHLVQLATDDPLTLLLNTRGLEDALQVTLAAAARSNLSTSAIMVDIDQFQKVNDNFGYDTGDHVIQATADTLSRMARNSDVIARTGGKEFLLILPDTPLHSARVLAERIRQTVSDKPLVVDQHRIQLTVSLGLASAEGQITLDELHQSARRAMYLAKRGGRNRVASVEHKPVQIVADSAGK
ncbi:MAG: diguanylate cyclase (GGDEF)-like protein [Halioglobus sp.]|jgi:diguanylate cyclase (GGDEF)-like protein